MTQEIFNTVTILINIVLVVFNLIAIIINAYFAKRNRVIYEIKKKVLRQVRGTEADIVIERNIEEINKLLQSGKYTILEIKERVADKDWDVILGKIRK